MTERPIEVKSILDHFIQAVVCWAVPIGRAECALSCSGAFSLLVRSISAAVAFIDSEQHEILMSCAMVVVAALMIAVVPFYLVGAECRYTQPIELHRVPCASSFSAALQFKLLFICQQLDSMVSQFTLHACASINTIICQKAASECFAFDYRAANAWLESFHQFFFSHWFNDMFLSSKLAFYLSTCFVYPPCPFMPLIHDNRYW